ncbi:GtrA family protein [Caballeronia concitans]|uniref:GtrA-like protein n=1 Tax=Caballeronia concitans TaxID=1777133 RepID=A0A658QZL9_9BURK|nr:GtrA family protein [Caballeronia concitans]SAL34899.1 GtrA-like protein [Caballeronia concitans]
MSSQFLRFAFAGGVGFLVDAGVLYVMLHLGVGPYAGRLVSFLCAVFVTWRINRRITFAATNNRSIWREFYEYLLAMIGGGACNYGAYALALRLLGADVWTPLAAVAAGSIAGMAVNFMLAKLWVFRHSQAGDQR